MKENEKITQKYILTDDYKPMYAMGKKGVNGPQQGPLRTPCRVPIEIVKEILKQDNPPKLYEVIELKRDSKNQPVFSERVELTLENYTMSYYDIAGVARPPHTKTEEVDGKKIVEITPPEKKVNVNNKNTNTAAPADKNDKPAEVKQDK